MGSKKWDLERAGQGRSDRSVGKQVTLGVMEDSESKFHPR